MFDFPMADKPAKRETVPVRKHSQIAGRCESTLWRRTDRRAMRRIVLAARRYELVERAFGRRSGPLGHVAIEVLEYLTNLIDFRTGRLDPAIETIMVKIKRSKDAVVRALAVLRQHGFLDWIRRYIPTGLAGQKGPQVRQTSNAYRLSLPPRAERLLARYGQDAPAAEDHVQAQAARKQAIEDHKNTLTPAELPLFVIEDPRLAEALSRFGSHFN